MKRKIDLWMLQCTSFLICLPLALSQYAGSYNCPYPWLSFEDKCYKFQLLTETFDKAQQLCEEDGASLVSINSLDEHNFIVRWLEANDNSGRQWFTSGRRNTEDSNDFFWEGDGTKVSGTQFWLNDEARADAGTIIVYHSDGRNWGWRMSMATPGKPYICELSKGELYKIKKEYRGYDYGLDETSPTAWEMGPTFYIQPSDVMFDTASDSTVTSVSMECAADGNPRPVYTWYKLRGKERLIVNPKSQPRFTIINGKLIINSPEDVGDNAQYECVAQNRFGSVISNVATLSFGYMNDFPKSERDPVTANAYTGVGIECNPPKHSYPKISFSWYKDSILNFIRPALKPYIFVSSDGKLYFSSVTKDDAGDYYCLVTRPRADSTVQGGKVSTPIRLNIIESIGSEQEPDIVNGFPKVFPTSPKVGDNLRIECVAWGTALTGSLEYSWSRSNGALPADSRMEDHNRVLIIPNAQLIDAGIYQCTVQRHTGQSTSETVQVSIEAAPYFNIPLKNQHVDHNSDLVWRCIAEGIPSIDYLWYLNGTLLTTALENMKPADKDRFRIERNSLTITSAKPQDAGMYQCSASNSRGTRYSSAQLRVLSFAPRFNKYPLQPNQYGTLGGSVTIPCQPEAAPYPEKTWFKNNGPLNPPEGPVDGGGLYVLDNGNLVIPNLKQSDRGIYKCTATNVHGSASSTGNLTVLGKTTVSNPPRDMTVTVNETSFFDCEASFNPTVDLIYDWWHNNYHIEFIKLKNLGNTIYKYVEPYYERGTGINSGGLFIRRTQFFHAGEYTCIARSSSFEISHKATLNVIGPPSEPAGVFSPDVADTDKELSGTSIRLEWWPGANNGRVIQSYIVEGKHTFADYWQEMKHNIPHTIGTQDARISTTLSNMTPYSQYSFRVRAVNILGIGEPSAPSPQYTTGAARPNITVKNIGGGGGKVGDLTITWDLLPKDKHYGPGLGYRVRWKKANIIDEEWETGEILDEVLRKKGMNGKYVTLVGSSNFYSPYDVDVLAFNAKGDGPAHNKSVRIMSAEDLPNATPTNITAVYFNSTAITVEWMPVKNDRKSMKGVLIGYRINYWIQNEEDETMALFNFVPGQRDNGQIIGLRPNTFYEINVQAINSAGNGPKSGKYISRTLRFAPKEAPQEVTVDPIDANTILVKWRGVSTEIDEEPLEGYMVRYFQRGENIYVATDIDAGKTTHIELSGFQTNTVYDLRVFGYSRGGDGLQSSPTLEFVLGPNCYVIEDSPDKEYIYKCNSASILQVSSVILLSVLVALLSSHL